LNYDQVATSAVGATGSGACAPDTTIVSSLGLVIVSTVISKTRVCPAKKWLKSTVIVPLPTSNTVPGAIPKLYCSPIIGSIHCSSNGADGISCIASSVLSPYPSAGAIVIFLLSQAAIPTTQLSNPGII